MTVVGSLGQKILPNTYAIHEELLHLTASTEACVYSLFWPNQ